MRDHFWSICFLCFVWCFNTLAWSSFIGFFQNRAVKELLEIILDLKLENLSTSSVIRRFKLFLKHFSGRLMVAPSRLTSFHWSTDERLQSTDHFCWSTDERLQSTDHFCWSTDELLQLTNEGLQSTDIFPLVDWWTPPVDWSLFFGRLMNTSIDWSLFSGRLMFISSQLIDESSLDFSFVSRLIFLSWSTDGFQLSGFSYASRLIFFFWSTDEFQLFGFSCASRLIFFFLVDWWISALWIFLC